MAQLFGQLRNVDLSTAYYFETAFASGWTGVNIVKGYPNQWVAIVDKKVVAAGTTIAEVEKEGTEKTGRDEFPIYFAERGIRVYKHRTGI